MYVFIHLSLFVCLFVCSGLTSLSTSSVISGCDRDTPYIRLVKFQLVRQIPDVYVSACVLAGKLFCCILHRIPKLFMV